MTDGECDGAKHRDADEDEAAHEAEAGVVFAHGSDLHFAVAILEGGRILGVQRHI